MNSPPLCNFCGCFGVRVAIDTSEPVISMSGGFTVVHYQNSQWLLCPVCCRLLDDENFEEIYERIKVMIWLYRRRVSVSREVKKDMMAIIESIPHNIINVQEVR